MKKSKQFSFQKFSTFHQFNHGGVLRRTRKGRGQRPLSTKESLHVVFKVDRLRLRSKSLRSPKVFLIVQNTILKYAKRFFIKIEQISIQNDHCHLLIRTSRRSHFHFFFRVASGQIAQVLEMKMLLVTDTPKDQLKVRLEERSSGPRVKNLGKMDTEMRSGAGTKLWMYRPFSRVVRGWKVFKTVRDYIQLNEKVVTGKIKYNSKRLTGLSSSDWEILWN